jgi:hypothetical protein
MLTVLAVAALLWQLGAGLPLPGPERVPPEIHPSLVRARTALPLVYDDACHVRHFDTYVARCVYGDPSGKITIVLFGDSHASQWFPPIDYFANRHHYRLVSLTHSFCPAAIVRIAGPGNTPCATWRRAALHRIAREHPDLVVIGSMPARLADGTGNRITDPARRARLWRSGYDRVIARLHGWTPRILLLSDSTMALDVPACLAKHLADARPCATPRDVSIDPENVAIERAIAAEDHVGLVVTTAWTCPSDPCPPFIGNVLVWRDDLHLTPTVTALFANRIAHALATALAGRVTRP